MKFNQHIKNNLHLIPNILSITRIILTVVVIILISLKSSTLYSFSLWDMKTNISSTFFASGIIFVIACLTDFLDGFLARKYNWISDFGKIWDAVSDKILTTSVYIYFAVLQFVPIYFVIIMIFRDFVIDGYRIQTNKYGLIIPANIFGKLKATLQMISLIIIFFCFNDTDTNSIQYYFVQNLFVILATIASVISGLIYVVSIEKKLKELKSSTKE